MDAPGDKFSPSEGGQIENRLQGGESTSGTWHNSRQGRAMRILEGQRGPELIGIGTARGDKEIALHGDSIQCGYLKSGEAWPPTRNAKERSYAASMGRSTLVLKVEKLAQCPEESLSCSV